MSPNNQEKPVNSMTGFGASSAVCAGAVLSVSITSTNHRFLDMQINAPAEFSVFEAGIRKRLKKDITRGKVVVNVNFNRGKSLPATRIDKELAQKYAGELRALARRLKIPPEIDLHLILSMPDVVRTQANRPGGKNLWPALRPVFEEALGKLMEMRRGEGEALRKDMAKSLSAIKRKTAILRRRSQKIPAKKSRDFSRALKKTGVEPDRETLTRAAAEILGRFDINEELIRLDSHAEQFSRTMSRAPSGPKMDFILQEVLREANTIASKTQDAAVSKKVVEIKAEIQKLREQVQNIE